ncbi:MAG: ATP synthase subunit I [Thiotrichales bacterium]|jgi:ATP synthase protein I|nr:ATP synthase subunit I [Thiotrichales bacterium]
MRLNIKPLLAWKLVFGGIALVAFGALAPMNVPASAYGLMLGLVNVGLLLLTVRIADARALTAPQQSMMILYASAAVRFVLLGVLFIVGISAAGLDPMPMVLTFVAMQLAQVMTLRGKKRLTD